MANIAFNQELQEQQIKAAVLKKKPVRLPPLPEQRAIAGVLSSLDDKIDLLHRQNKTLEAIAETLFRCRRALKPDRQTAFFRTIN
jgi:hypothetical protein